MDHMVKFAEEGVGLSVAVSIGNKALIRELELLRYFASDPETDVIAESMIKCLKAHRILEGYRGSEPINLKESVSLLLTFSSLVMDLEKVIKSIDLNPVICSSSKCIIADARIILRD